MSICHEMEQKTFNNCKQHSEIVILTQSKIQQGIRRMAIAQGTIMATIHARLVLLFGPEVLITVG